MNRTWNPSAGPVKALRDQVVGQFQEVAQTQQFSSGPKIQIIKKKLLNLPRSDSVRSNISAYPILQNGGSKVVKLIRYEGGQQQQISDTQSMLNDTNLVSTLIGVAGQQFIRKV